MKRALKLVGLILLIILALLIIGGLFINYQGIPTYDVQKIDHQVISTPESIERGKKLVSMLCANCHKDHQTGKLTGTRMPDAPAEFGVIYSQNITQDKKYGIGEWTDGEILYLLRTGIKKDGKYAPPYMAKLPTMADEDIDAIISYLKSGDEMVAADPTPDYPCEPSLLTKILCRVAFKPLPFPAAKIELPDTSDKVALGKYLAHNLDCFSCHSADFKTNDFLQPELSAGYFGGGNLPLNLEGQLMPTSNLTPDMETGIGTWTAEQFVKAVKNGFVEGQEALRYPMTPYVYLTDDEAKAIYLYLKSIPSIKNKVDRAVIG
ncbi:MAG: c-type cytochrome [Saprospiraceae bacterium]|nr:c-type cytochrome [Saprospiraceae bacterium]